MRTLMILTLAALMPVWAQKQWDQIEFPPLNPIQEVKPDKSELANGMLVYLVEDDELPIINLRFRFSGGSVFDPADKLGLAAITAQVMREGGTTTMSGEEIDTFLEDRAASIEVSFGGQVGFVSVSMLKENAAEVLQLVADLLQNPAFPEDKIKLAKTQMSSGIARRNDDLMGIANREFSQVIYGEDSPYARTMEYATVAAIERDDLVALHQRFFHPNNMRLGAVGDFKTKEMKKTLADVFGSWSKNDAFQRPELPKVDYEWRNTLYVADKDDVTQAQIRMGHIGGRFDDEDYYALNLLSQILAGGFGTRIVDEVRTNRGLAYAAFGTWSPNFLHPGVFFLGAGTKSETVVEAAQVMRGLLEVICREEVTDEELKLAKDGIFNSFVFNFDSRFEVLDRMMLYEFYGYPVDFLQKYQEGIRKVTKADILSAAKKHLRPDQMVGLVVGKVADIGDGLDDLGFDKRVELDISIPEPKVEAATVSADSRAKGDEWRDKLIASRGGADKLAGIADIHTESTLTIKMGGSEMAMDVAETFSVHHMRVKQVMTTPMGEMAMGYGNEQAWMARGGQVLDAPPGQAEGMRESWMRKPPVLLTNPDFVFNYVRDETVDAGACAVVQVTHKSMEEFQMDLWIGQEDHLIHQVGYQGANPTTGAPGYTLVKYSDVERVDGMPFPKKLSITVGGDPVMSTEFKTFEILEKPEDFYTKPETE